jgi:hypothetical protein
MKAHSATIILLLISILVTTPVLPVASKAEGGTAEGSVLSVYSSSLPPGLASDSVLRLPASEQSAISTSATVLLPLVASGHRGSPPCSIDSPFGIQIAALHQVSSTQTKSEAAWLARYDEAFPTLAEALKRSGACWTRVRVDWSLIQPEPPPSNYVWSPYHDEKLRLLAETGVQIIAHIDGIPEWAGDLTYGPIHHDRLDEFAQFLTDLVNHYKQPPYEIRHWELFNEPDRTFQRDDREDCEEAPGLGWGCRGDEYAEMLSLAYQAIKAADPDATVLMGGVAQDWFIEYGGPFYRYFPDDLMESLDERVSPQFDVLNIHYFPDFHREWERWDPNSDDRIYGWLPAPTCGDLFDGQGQAYDAGGVDLIAKVSHFRNRLRTCFDLDKPVWVTEVGEHGHAGDPASLAQQARYVIQGNTRGLAAGVKTIVWFVLVSPPYDYQGQGLLYKDDWSPKPAFFTYQTLTAELEGYRYARTLDVPGVEGYLFRDASGREKTVAWGLVDPSSTDTVPLSFAPARRLRIVNVQGSVSFVDDGGNGDADGKRNGIVELKMTADPVFVSQ